MSDIAVKIQRNVASTPPPYSWTDEDFYVHEIGPVIIFDGRSSNRKILGDGSPKIIKRTGFGYVTITFKLTTPTDELSTLDKLKNLETFTGTDQRLIIYPKYQKDPEIARICILPTGQIPDEVGLGGYNDYGEEITVQFLELEKGIGTVIEEDEV